MNNNNNDTDNDTDTISTDINDYSIEDIYELLNLDTSTISNPSDHEINDAIDPIITNMKKEGNQDIVNFFSNIQNILSF